MDCNNSTSLNDEGEVPAKAVRKVKSFESNEVEMFSKWSNIMDNSAHY